MRIPRLFLPASLHGGASVTLDEDRSHYLRTVLRLRTGDELRLFNGEGTECPAVLRELRRDGVRLELGQPVLLDVESPLSTHLGLGISRGERMDLAIQKAVELGVADISPLISEHCVVHLDESRKHQRWRHWQKVAESACEQCGRNRLPEIHEPAPFGAWLVRQQGIRLLLDPRDGRRLGELPPPQDRNICLLSGPEGGFAEGERLWALDCGFVPIRLGPRILRTETAALAALTAIQTLWGDLG